MYIYQKSSLQITNLVATPFMCKNSQTCTSCRTWKQICNRRLNT